MKPFVAAAVAVSSLALAASSPAQDWTERRSGVAFAVHRDGMTLLGAGLRVKKIIFTFKAYAVGFYVSDEALSGPLARYAGQPVTDELRRTLVSGDFPKEVVLHFLRDLGQGKIQGAMREALEGADPAALNQFISYFPEVKKGEECVLRWGQGGTLESTMAGQAKPPIANRALAEQLFGLYVGPDPLQDDFKADMLARFGQISAAGEVRHAEGTVESVQPNGFTMTDSTGRELVFVADRETVIVARGASHKMESLAASGKPATVAEFIAPRQRVSVKYVEIGGRLTLRDVQVR